MQLLSPEQREILKEAYNLQKLSKESGIFQLLDNICSFLRKGEVKKGRRSWHNAPRRNTLLVAITRGVQKKLLPICS